MAFRDIIGHERALATLRASLERGQLHHGYLFGGPDGVGKELVARTLAQAANCESGGLDPCGSCAQCRKIGSRNHPDILWVMPEAEQVARGWAGRADFDGTPSREIKIAQIRQLQDRLVLRRLEARRRFAIIVSAEAMNQQAQNALLKTLEEPPADTTLVLVSASPNALLPTIRSRCARLAFGPLPVDAVAAQLQRVSKVDAGTARLCASLAGGSLGAALQLDPATFERRRELIRRNEALQPGDARAALAFAQDFGDEREKAQVNLALLAAWYRDIASAAAGAAGEALVNADLEELAVAASQRLGASEALRRAELCAATRDTLRGNASPRLQLEQLALRFVFPQA
ncbi:MAG: DNA polymerase III subunit delta' [Myxococcales bacterium]